jgi:hypothetical protein
VRCGHLRSERFQAIGAPCDKDEIIAASGKAVGVDSTNTGRRSGDNSNFP